MNYILKDISKNSRDLIDFKKRLSKLKVSLREFENKTSGLRADIIGNEFRKSLEAFVLVIHTRAQSSQVTLYDSLLHLTSDQELERQQYFSQGDKGFIKALLKFVHVLGNYSSHHQIDPSKQINEEHIHLGRIAFYLLIKTYLSQYLDQDDYSFLQVNQVTSNVIEKPNTEKKRSPYKLLLGICLLLVMMAMMWVIQVDHQSDQRSTFAHQSVLDQQAPLKSVQIASEKNLNIVLQHTLSGIRLAKAMKAAQTYAQYRIALEQRNPQKAFPVIAKVLRCYYGTAQKPRHELLRSKRWSSAKPKRKKAKMIYLRTDPSVIGKHWIQLSTADQAGVDFGTAQVFVLEQTIDKKGHGSDWLISAEYGRNYWACAPKVKQGQLYWP